MRISDEVELRVRTAYNKMERTRQMMAVSQDLDFFSVLAAQAIASMSNQES